MNAAEKEFLHFAQLAAEQAGHIYPEMAACEAALESGYGTSKLATQGHNLFGMKQHCHPVYPTLNLPTQEFVKGDWVATSAAWVEYPNLRSCFADRIQTLKRLAPFYPHYARALAAATATAYVMEVSQTWSTDPGRGEKVLDIYDGAADWSAS